jgi:hypothetical protein
MLKLDKELESHHQKAAKSLVSSLDSHEPSLEWRSSLNARLQAAGKVKKRRAWLAWTTAVAAPAAAVAAFVIFFGASEPSQGVVAETSVAADTSIEDELYTHYMASDSRMALGLDMPHEPGEFDWSSIDGL